MLTQNQSPGGVQIQSSTTLGGETFLFDGYQKHPEAWDELFAAAGTPHGFCQGLVERLGGLTSAEFQGLRTGADLVFINQGITFSVYSDRRGTEKIFTFDLIPRPVEASEWQRLESGLHQRIKALNLFLHDLYHDRRALKERAIPADLVRAPKA